MKGIINPKGPKLIGFKESIFGKLFRIVWKVSYV